MNPGPDFLCIGQQKAGTDWLYDQLQFHADMWMPPEKELHYFDRRFPRVGLLNQAREALEAHDLAKLNASRKRRAFRPLDDRDMQFFRLLTSGAETFDDLTAYERLFQFKSRLQSGDMTPQYCALDSQTISQIVSRFPALKVVLLIRDPVERAWSQICHVAREGRLDLEILDDRARLEAYLHKPQMAGRAFATQIARRWQACVRPDRFLVLQFDELVDAPERSRRRVAEFLGIRNAGFRLPADHNRKAGNAKLTMNGLTRDVLTRHFHEELGEAARLFGGAARAWSSRWPSADGG